MCYRVAAGKACCLVASVQHSLVLTVQLVFIDLSVWQDEEICVADEGRPK
ncbi:MAG: hypothetical protein J1F40_03865 [Prevotellaceae bacterium]|nr:hypothetical protein [Prevotellaceae bacterium]